MALTEEQTKLVQRLRVISGYPILGCKEFLEKANWDINEAFKMIVGTGCYNLRCSV